MNEAIDASLFCDDDVCFLPTARSVQFYNDYISNFFASFRSASEVLQSKLSAQDRTAMMCTFDVQPSLFHSTLFSNLVFPMIVEYACDYLGEAAEKALAVTGTFQDWEIDVIANSPLRMYSLRYNDREDETVQAVDVMTHEVIPIHASVMGVPLRSGDKIIARIFQTPMVNVVVSPVVIPNQIATELKGVLDQSKNRAVRSVTIIRELIAFVEKLNTPNPKIESSEQDIRAVNDAWSAVCERLPDRPLNLDGISADGTIYRLNFSPGDNPELFCFRDVHARTAVLRGGLHRESRGFMNVQWAKSDEVLYGAFAPKFVVGISNVGKNFEPKEVDSACLTSVLNVLFWVRQSLENRAFDFAA